MTLFALHDYSADLKRKGCFPITKDQAGELNEQGYGIFFTPNLFRENKRVKENLKELRHWFIDMDGGTKDDMLEKILNFPLVPSMIIETNGGYHAYWSCPSGLVDSGMVDQYNSILNSLIIHFGADTNAGGENRVLRVPGFYHCKDSSNKFLINMFWRKDLIYTCEEMLKALPEAKQELIPIECDKKKMFFTQVPQDDFWQKVFDLDCFQYLPVLSNTPECNGEVFRIERVGSKGKIFVDGEMVSSCWIDTDGKIGSHGKGGPSLANWLAWYGNDWSTIASCLKRLIPGLSESIKLGNSFDW